MRRSGRDSELPPPLELLCLRALWTLGEGNVAQVRELCGRSKPLAYTTVLTLLERLARRGLVSRKKSGRAFVYMPAVSRDAMRRSALRELVDSLFDGSPARLEEFLRAPEPPSPPPAEPSLDATLL
jgi:predicted transcriptional regulator